MFGSLGATGRFSETTPYDPRSPYSASKAPSDHLVKAWHHTYGLPVVLTSCSNNYCPWQFPEKLIPLYGGGQHVRDWMYVDALLPAGAPHSQLITRFPGSAPSWAGSRATASRRCWRVTRAEPG